MLNYNWSQFPVVTARISHRRSVLPKGHRRLFSGLSLLFLLAAASTANSRSQKSPSAPRSAPQISGRLIGTSGDREIILEYKTDRGSGAFIGKIQATCTIPSPTTSAAAAPIALAEIQKGSHVTLFYVRHTLSTKKGRKTENVVLAIRFDQPDRAHKIAKGQAIPCYQAAQGQPSK